MVRSAVAVAPSARAAVLPACVQVAAELLDLADEILHCSLTPLNLYYCRWSSVPS